MRTSEIIQGLLETTSQWIYDDVADEYYCPSCKKFLKDGHNLNCNWVKYTEAAKEYLAIMKVK